MPQIPPIPTLPDDGRPTLTVLVKVGGKFEAIMHCKGHANQTDVIDAHIRASACAFDSAVQILRSLGVPEDEAFSAVAERMITMLDATEADEAMIRFDRTPNG